MKTLTLLEVQEISGGYAPQHVEIRLPIFQPILVRIGVSSVGGRDQMSVFTRAAR